MTEHPPPTAKPARDSAQARILAGLALGLVLIAAGGLLSLRSLGRMNESSEWVTHTLEILKHAAHVTAVLSDLTAGARGYLLTSDPALLQEMAQARDALPEELRHVRVQLRTPAQQARWRQLEGSIAERVQSAEELVRTHGTNAPAALALFKSGRGTRIIEIIQRQMAEFTDAAQVLLAQRQAQQQADVHRSFLITGGTAAAGMLLVGVTGLFAVRENRQRRAAERLAREQEEQARTTLSSIGDGVVTTDAEGRISRLNPVAEELTGWTSATAQGKPVAEVFRILNEHTRQTVECPVARVLREGIVVGLANHTLLIRKDGRETPIADSGAPIRDDEGRLRGVVLVFRDQTAEHKAEKHMAGLVKELQDVKLAFDQHSIVAITDAQGKITFVNDKFCAISQYSREELIGQDHRLINSGHHSKEFIRDLWTTIGQGKVWKGELKNRAKDGPFYWVDTTIVPFLKPDGKPYQYVAIRTDITERKRTNDALEAANQELESFSYSVSHDLRAPLRGVDSFSRIVLEDYGPKLDAEGRRLLNVVRGEAQRMGQLIDDLLDFSRLGRQELRATGFDMTTLAQSVFASLDAAVRERVKHFELKPLPAAHSDRAMMQQVLFNLIANAAKFSGHAESPSIEIGGSTGDGFNTYYVRDNGVGFDPRYTHKLFGVFQRLHTEDEFEGTGVGLALVQRIIHRHGGKVWAEGKLNAGATFYFALPTRKET